MAHTYHDLKKMTVAQLREIAQGIEHEAVQGFSVMHKDTLLPAICNALDIEMHEHHDVVGINKSAIKSEIKEVKKRRDAALASRDHDALKAARRRLHHLKRKIRKATV